MDKSCYSNVIDYKWQVVDKSPFIRYYVGKCSAKEEQPCILIRERPEGARS